MPHPIDKKLIDLYIANVDLLEDTVSYALNRPRAAAIESLNLSGLPGKGSADGDKYHYTDIRAIWEKDYELYFTPSYRHAACEQMNIDGYMIDLMNGFHKGEQKTTVLDNGVIYGSLAGAAKNFPEITERYYNTATDIQGDRLAALATAFTQDGAFVYVPKGVGVDAPFVINNSFYADAESLAVFSSMLLIFEEGCHAKVLINNRTCSKECFAEFRNREIFVNSNASVEITELYGINPQSCVVNSTYIVQEAASRLATNTIIPGGGLVRCNIAVALNGEDAENHTDGLMIAGTGEQIDLNTTISHNAPRCTSNELVKGIAANGGTSVFGGRIYVAPDAQQTAAYQKNNNLLLSENSHAYTKPQLEIYADNVKCSHGATVGQLDTQAVYYMRQRGISEKDARKLQMYGFVHEIIGRCSIEAAADAVQNEVSEKIERL